MGEGNEKKKPAFHKFLDLLLAAFENPITWVRETIVQPNRPEYYWYHERLPRVPTVDECYEDDYVCQYEADEQYHRDRKVELTIIKILEKRWKRCMLDHPNERELCQDLHDTFNNASTNFFIKYGDLSFTSKAVDCLMKQKHRMAWERRHGPVGSRRKPEVGSMP